MMKKPITTRIISLLLAAMLCFALAACSGDKATSSSAASTAAKVDTTVLYLNGPTGMGLSKLMKDNADGTASNNYTFTGSSTPTDVTSEIIKGNYDIAALPINLASVLYTKTQGALQIAAVNTLGVLSILENGTTIQSVADLKGKTIYATGQGSTPEFVLRYILTKNGIDPDKDVTIEYLEEHSALAAKIIAGEAAIAMLPEPNVTTVLTGNSAVRVALDLTDEWNKVAESGSQLIQGCIVVRKAYADEHKEALNAFLKEYQASAEYVNQNPADASLLIEQYGIVAKAAVAEKAIPGCHICYIDGTEMKTSVGAFLQVLYNADHASVGGVVPDDAFYYQK